MVKNEQIKHMIRKRGYYNEGRYVCNTAVGTTPEKSVHRWDKVTCKNCLKQAPEGYQRRSSPSFKKEPVAPQKVERVSLNEFRVAIREELAGKPDMVEFHKGFKAGMIWMGVLVLLAFIIAVFMALAGVW